MNFLKIIVNLFVEGCFVDRASIKIETENELCKKLLFRSFHGEYFGFEFDEDFSSLPVEVKNFILLFKKYTASLLERSESEILISFPAETLFFENLLKLNPEFFLKERRFFPEFLNIPYFVHFDIDIDKYKIILSNREEFFLIQTDFKNFIIKDDKVYIMPYIFRGELLKEIFIKKEVNIDYDFIHKFLQVVGTEAERIKKYFNVPEIINVRNGNIVFYFDEDIKNEYYLRAFFVLPSGNEIIEYPFYFEKVRRSVLLQEDIFISFNNRVYVIASGSPLYEKAYVITNAVKNSFFGILNEYNENEIHSFDKEALFHKFLLEIVPYVELRKGNKKIDFLCDKFEEKEIKLISHQDDMIGSIEWLEVQFKYKIRDIVLALREIRVLIEKGYLEKDNTLISLPADEIKELKEFFIESNPELKDDKAYIQKNKIFFIKQTGAELRLPDKEPFSSLHKYIKQGKRALEEIEIPLIVKSVIRNYQKVGVSWLEFLRKMCFGGILADEMGLGKTLQVLTFLYIHKGKGTSLVICPAALMYNWHNEIKKYFGEELSCIVIDGTKKERVKKIKNIFEYDVAITSYPLVHIDLEEYKTLRFFYCVLDEAQHIKNKLAERTISVKKISAENRIAVTGTPVENTVAELWSIFDFVMPDFLGNHAHFKKHFEKPLNSANSEERQKALQRLKDLTRPFILRRTKQSVLRELPPKTEQDIMLDLTEKQKALYIDTLSKIKQNLFGKFKDMNKPERSTMDILAALTRLRQICLHPALVEPELSGVEDVSIKLKALMELLMESIDSGHRVVVFSQFVEMLKIIRLELKKEQIEYFYIDGRTKNRVDLVDNFNNSDIPIFLISLKAGGTGLNVIGADSAILFDPWWNPAVENQAIDRIHRIGQKNPVNIYRLITIGTIEEKIKRLQLYKKGVFDSLVTSSQSFIKSMTWEDLKELFSL